MSSLAAQMQQNAVRDRDRDGERDGDRDRDGDGDRPREDSAKSSEMFKIHINY